MFKTQKAIPLLRFSSHVKATVSRGTMWCSRIRRLLQRLLLNVSSNDLQWFIKQLSLYRI